MKSFPHENPVVATLPMRQITSMSGFLCELPSEGSKVERQTVVYPLEVVFLTGSHITM